MERNQALRKFEAILAAAELHLEALRNRALDFEY
jgi:hypothetical protein